MKLNDGEILIKKGSANYLIQSEGVGGKLYLTNQRLFFKSHFFNIHTCEEMILLEDIIKIESKGRGLFFRTILILVKNGSTERFVVRDPKTWVEQIENIINRQPKKDERDKDALKVDHKIPPISYKVIAQTIFKVIIIAICVVVILFFLFMVSN